MAFSRRAFMAGTAGVALTALSAPSTANGAAAQPNFLFIAIDDLNDMVSSYGGYPGVITPNFERLARVSRVYANAQTPAPACSPARTSVMFGREPFHSGV